jgi:hypothetical protein
MATETKAAKYARLSEAGGRATLTESRKKVEAVIDARCDEASKKGDTCAIVYFSELQHTPLNPETMNEAWRKWMVDELGYRYAVRVNGYEDTIGFTLSWGHIEPVEEECPGFGSLVSAMATREC